MSGERKPLGGWSNVPYAREASLQGGQMLLILITIALVSMLLGYAVRLAIKRFTRSTPILLPLIAGSLLGALLLVSVAMKVSTDTKVDGQENATHIANALENNYPMKLRPQDKSGNDIAQGRDFTATVRGRSATCNIEYKVDESGITTKEQSTITLRPLCKQR